MRKYTLLISLTAIIFCQITVAQNTFVVQNTTAKTFKTLQQAYDSAVNGDTIYLPGGSFNFPASIDKKLAWIGVGYHPDSNEATYYTRINNVASLTGNTDSSYFTGIYFASNFNMGAPGNDAVDVTLLRCRIGGSITFKNADNTERDISTIVSECIIDGNLDANYGANIFIEKSIVRGVSYDFRSSVFDRIILTLGSRSGSYGYSFGFSNIENCFITNSVINYQTYTTWRLEHFTNVNNNLKNNILAGNITFPDGTNTGANNQTGVDLSTVFESIDGSLSDFSYAHNFHLKAGSPAIGTGISGADIGLYGGVEPFKDGGLPNVPHVKSVDIATETTNGILHIEIEAVAQDK